MAVREFVDKRGVSWKVWDITPDSIHRVARLEFLLGEFEEGWLTFESASERRRLPELPEGWMHLSDGGLEALCERATVVTSRDEPESQGAELRRLMESDTLEREEHDRRRSPAETTLVRTFLGPGGRQWMATVVALGTGAETRRVLRFTANDGAVLDLANWPDDWYGFTTNQLVELGRRAEPPRTGTPELPPRRRTEDQGR
jgi:hypothetical protein